MVRQKNRYLLCHILYPLLTPQDKKEALPGEAIPSVVVFHQPSSATLNSHLLLRDLREKISELYGDYGSGMVSGSLNVKYLSTATSTFILKVSRAHYRLAWSALSFMTELSPARRACVIRVVRVSGTIRKAEEEAIRLARATLLRVRPMGDKTSEGAEEGENLEEDLGEPIYGGNDSDSDEDDDEEMEEYDAS